MNNLLPDKPRHGERCNGCGICCALSLCQAGEIMFPGAQAPCPALKLEKDGKSTYCAAVRAEAAGVAAGILEKPLLANALGIGEGCTMDDVK